MNAPLYLPPNMEALVSDFLRNQPELAALITTQSSGEVRVYTALPKDRTFPLVRVTQLLDTPAGAPLWAIAYEIQIDAWGGSKADAFRIANLCRALIDSRLAGEYAGRGIVNGSSPGALLDLPDEDFLPAKPRWLFTSTIHAHPLATVATS